MPDQLRPYRVGELVTMNDEALQSKTGYTRQQLSYMLGPLKIYAKLKVPIDGHPHAQHLFFAAGPFTDVDRLDALSLDCEPVSATPLVNVTPSRKRNAL